MDFDFKMIFILLGIFIVIGLLNIKRLRHKLLLILLIGLVLFTYVTFSMGVGSRDLDLKSTSGIIDAGKLYFSWFGTLFKNTKSITAYAVSQNWTEIDESFVNNNSVLEEVLESSIWDKL